MRKLHVFLIVAGGAVAAKVGWTLLDINQSRSSNFEREQAVVRLCDESGAGVDGPEAEPDHRIRYLEKREDGGWQDARNAWVGYAHPELVVCQEPRTEVLDTRKYVDEANGRSTEVSRRRRHLRLRVIEVRTGKELLSEELHGAEPPPLRDTMLSSDSAWSPKFSQQEIDAVVRKATRNR